MVVIQLHYLAIHIALLDCTPNSWIRPLGALQVFQMIVLNVIQMQDLVASWL